MDTKQTPREITQLVLKAVALAMGVAVIVLGLLGNTTPQTQISLLSIGLFCMALASFQDN
jgi:hypothetical protein